MGRDKAAVEIDGVASLDRVLTAAREAVDTVVVVGGERADAIPDLDPGGGPVQAIAAAWRAHPGRPLIVLGCDMPFVTGALVRRLVGCAEAPREATLVRAGGRAQPLCACYAPTAAAAFERALATGQRGLMRVVGDLDTGWLDEDGLSARERLGARDFDTPEELSELLADADDRTTPRRPEDT
ncbi:MAG: hypothetical protein EP329_07320 [Deltaproteobacteria bacterium]|nr:MAG: hypothetical protein EP329_07320 [Deltaproteobacteria bacterium]